jgi:hypothetical protein
MMARRTLALLAAAALSASALAARAEGTGTYPRREAPFVLRTEAHLILFSLSNTDAFVAITAGASVLRWLAIEGTAGIGAGKNISGDAGGHFMLAGRVSGDVSANHRHALTVAAGPLLVAGGGYGRVLIAHGEAGYEYRRAGGVTLLLAAGLGVLVENSAMPALRRGDLGGHARVGLGLSF